LKRRFLKKESPLFDDNVFIRKEENFNTKELIFAAVGAIKGGKPTLLNDLSKL